MERVWRGFAKEFSGKEIRYDDFVNSRSDRPSLFPQDDSIIPSSVPANPAWQKCLDDSNIGKKAESKESSDKQRLAQLQKKIAAQRKQQHLAVEAEKEREVQLADMWEEEREARRKKADEERAQRKLQLAQLRRPKMGKDNTFLTALPVLLNFPSVSSKVLDAASKQMDPRPPASVLRTSARQASPLRTENGQKKGKSSIAVGKALPKKLRTSEWKRGQSGNTQKTKKEAHVADDVYTGPVNAEAVAKFYPGLAGSAEGRAIKDRALALDAGPCDPTASLMSNKVLVRKAQAQLMNKLSNQLVHYRQQIKVHFKRILEAVEVQYSDGKHGRSCNLARVKGDAKT
eukprot:GEMP01057703.1.p1 GENE.GEMP01057703.1~~GEMP01057703.1.p1  ORF type:complete len:344 (+),score=94.42 GEMP01057703.1:98-1129(+)